MEDAAPEESVGGLLQRYEEEIKAHITLDDFNLKQVQMELPIRRHFWVGRLMFHKQEILKLNKLKKQARKKITSSLHTDSPVTFSDKGVSSAVLSHPVMAKIDEKIEEQELLVDYLSKVEANFRAMSFDIKNLLQIQVLEQS